MHLKDHGKIRGPKRVALPGRQPGQIAPQVAHLPGIRGEQAGEDVEQGGFARAGPAHDAYEFPSRNVQRCPAKGRGVAGVCGIGFNDVVCDEHGKNSRGYSMTRAWDGSMRAAARAGGREARLERTATATKVRPNWTGSKAGAA